MSTITSLNATDNGSTSRGVINTNFTNLNTDKAELSGAAFTGAISSTGTVTGSNLSGTNTGDQTISDVTISVTDVTTNNVTSTKHGFAPKSPADATKFLNGDITPAFAQVKDSDLAFTDVTTNNVSATAHGFAPKFPNNTTTFLRGDGTYAAPPVYSVTARINTDTTISAGTTTDTNIGTLSGIAAMGINDVLIIDFSIAVLATSGTRVDVGIKLNTTSIGLLRFTTTNDTVAGRLFLTMRGATNAESISYFAFDSNGNVFKSTISSASIDLSSAFSVNLYVNQDGSASNQTVKHLIVTKIGG